MTVEDRIEKRIALRAPLVRVWNAITVPEEFGAWFCVKLEGEFTEGRTIRGRVTTPGYEHLTFEMQIDRIKPERCFAYRWHPYAVDIGVDYSSEPTTLVEFHLSEAGGRTALTISESGFNSIPLARRAEAFQMNDRGWTEQAGNIERYLSKP